MSVIFLPIGIALPTLIGWLLLRTIEGKTPVLSTLERVATGFIIGLTGTMYITFLAHIAGLIRFDLWGFLSVQITLVIVTGIGFILTQFSIFPFEGLSPSGPNGNFQFSTRQPSHTAIKKSGEQQNNNVVFPRWAHILLWITLAWATIKVLATSITFLLLTPTFVDDAIDNWNMRGKLFFVHQELVPGFPGEPLPAGGGIYAYPPTVSMVKAWLATLAGIWSDPLINSIHLLWFLAILAILFASLRSILGKPWGLLGVAIFGNLPLAIIHATNPYADMFLAAHISACASLLLRALFESDARRSRTFLLLVALPLALLPFTKNEGLVLYFPALALAFLLTVFHLARHDILHRHDVLRVILWTLVLTSSVLLPWLLFKWMHGMSFGNAKGLPSVLELSWNLLSLRAIIANTFFEGNWLLLFMVFFPLLLWRWRQVFTFPLLPISLVFLLPYLMQIALFTLTPLSTEAVKQTGYARGLLHIVPIAVLLTVFLLQETLSSSADNQRETREYSHISPPGGREYRPSSAPEFVNTT